MVRRGSRWGVRDGDELLRSQLEDEEERMLQEKFGKKKRKRNVL